MEGRGLEVDVKVLRRGFNENYQTSICISTTVKLYSRSFRFTSDVSKFNNAVIGNSRYMREAG
jgi:hypothetical protein